MNLLRWEAVTLRVVKLLISSIFFLPLVVLSGFYFPFITPRNFLFRIIVGVALGGFLMLVVARPKFYFPKKNGLIIAFLIFPNMAGVF